MAKLIKKQPGDPSKTGRTGYRVTVKGTFKPATEKSKKEFIDKLNRIKPTIPDSLYPKQWTDPKTGNTILTGKKKGGTVARKKDKS